MKTKMKTNHALCGLISGLLLLAAGTAQTHAGLLLPAAPGANLYVGNASDDTIEQFTPGGVGSVFANTGLNATKGLAFDSAGNLYAANGDNTIEKFTPGGVGSVFASTGLNHPTGLAFDSAGNLYAANRTGGTIEKFTPGGVGSVFASTGLSFPQGLAFDSAGNLYAANNATIEEFTSGGVGSVFASGFQPEFLAFGPAPLPEPGTTLFGIACVGVAALRRRRNA